MNKLFVALAVVLMVQIANAEEQVIRVPGEGWRIRFDAPKLTPQPANPRSVPPIFFGRADRFQLSFFVEAPRCGGPETDENIYNCRLKTLLNSPYVMRNTVRGNTVPNGVLVTYLTQVERDGLRGTAFNANLLFARKGKWADVHTSFASPIPEDVKALYAIMDSIKVENDPAKNSSEQSRIR